MSFKASSIALSIVVQIIAPDWISHLSRNTGISLCSNASPNWDTNMASHDPWDRKAFFIEHPHVLDGTKDKNLLFLRRDEFPLRTMNLPSSPRRNYIAGRAAMSIFAKNNLMSALQAFGYGGGLGDRRLIWTGSRSSFHHQMVKPFFLGSREKWLLGIERAKMVTTGRLSMQLQKAPQLSKAWGEGQGIR